jgi:Caspase domain
VSAAGDHKLRYLSPLNDGCVGGSMLRVIGLLFGLLVSLMSIPLPALVEKRIALLICNKDYKPGVGALVNPLNDVRVMGEALKAVGFEVLKPS